jgi:hypothetical protein
VSPTTRQAGKFTAILWLSALLLLQVQAGSERAAGAERLLPEPAGAVMLGDPQEGVAGPSEGTPSIPKREWDALRDEHATVKEPVAGVHYVHLACIQSTSLAQLYHLTDACE